MMMFKPRIYLASSWRNTKQPMVLDSLRSSGFEVYDFRHPAPGNDGFSWSEIDPDWQKWSASTFRFALDHSVAERGFKCDRDALVGCDACVLLLPSGRSAHLEAGYVAGAGKPVIVLLEPEGELEPELMYKLATAVCLTAREVVRELERALKPSPQVGRSPEPAEELLNAMRRQARAAAVCQKVAAETANPARREEPKE